MEEIEDIRQGELSSVRRQSNSHHPQLHRAYRFEDGVKATQR